MLKTNQCVYLKQRWTYVEKFIFKVPDPIRVLTRGVSSCGLAICTKMYQNAKEELYKLKIFTMQKMSSSQNPLEKTKILQDIVTL
jgi:hypothetical protein